MASITDTLLTAVDAYSDELNETEGYKELLNTFYQQLGGAENMIQGNEIFDAFCALNNYAERYFYEKGLRDGIELVAFVKRG